MIDKQNRKQPPAWPSEADLHRLVPVAHRVLHALPRMSPGHTPARNRAGHGLEFLDYRAYVAGDALRDVDWRLSARSRQPYLRRFEDEASADWVICIDNSESMHTPGPDKWNLACQIAACFAYLLIDSGCRVSLVIHNDQVIAHRPLGRGRRQYLQILAALDHAGQGTQDLAGSDPGCCHRFLPDGAALCVIGDFLQTESIDHGLKRLLAAARPPIHVVQVTDRQEIDRLPDGALALRDCESRAQHDATVTHAYRESARHNLATLCERLAGQCRTHGVYYIEADVQQDWLAVMSAHLRALDRTTNLPADHTGAKGHALAG